MVENPIRMLAQTMDCKTSEQLWLYAAGALDRDEAAAIAEHVDDEGCATCRQRLGEAEEALAGLVMPEAPVEPPAALKGRVMARIEATEAEPAGVTTDANADPDPDLVDASLDAIVEADGLPDRPTDEAQPDGPSRWRRMAAPALAAVLAALLTYGAAQMTGGADRQELRELRREVEKLEGAEQRLTRLDGMMSDWGEMVGTLASSAARIVPLKEVSGESEASGRFLVNPERHTGCLLISGLQPAGSKAKGAYRVWLVTKDNEPHEVGALRVDSTGRGWLVADLGMDLSDVVRVNVGYRPDGGETDKPGTTLLAADFTAQK